MKELLNKEKSLLEIVTDIYIFAIIIIFPLMVDKTGFFHILECKWYSFVSIATLYIVSNILIVLYFLIFKKVNIFKKKKISIIEWLAIAFLLINIISCFLSPFFKDYDLFIGVGRGEGLIAMSLYSLSFLCVVFFGKFKRRHITYFVIASILESLICCLQYVGFNPFNMFQNGIGTHNVSFMGTIGNIDFLSAIYTIFLSISFSSFVFLEDNKKWEKVLCIISILMGFFIIGIIDVQSGKAAFLGTIILIFPFVIATNKRLSRFMVVIATILMAYCTNQIMNPQYHFDVGKLGFYWQFNYITILFILVSVALVYLAREIRNLDYDFSNNNKVIKNIYLGIIGCGVVSILFLYFIDLGEGTLYEIHELLHGNFDDDFGTYRIFLWKRTFAIFPEYPILGSGPDSFAIRFMARYTADVASIGELTINDTAANVYLTMLINIGIVGLLDYLAFLFFQVIEGIKKINKYSAILLISVLCYMIQDCFNLSLVIVTPIFWLLMALHINSLEGK